jgi:hypothetical protein
MLGKYWESVLKKGEAVMKKVIFLVTITILFSLSSLFVLADEIRLKAKEEHEWEMYNQDDDFVGVLQKTEEGNFTFFDKDGNYLGLILKSEKWKPKGVNPKITPEDAKLYLNALEAIKGMK